MNKIRLQDLTPKIYYDQSRDFQFIGRLFDAVLNSVKTSADSIYNLPLSDNSDKQLIDLMTLTLGFKSKHNYNVKQLSSLCSAFCEVIRNKGSIKSIELAINSLLNAEGIKEPFAYDFDQTNPAIINLYIPQNLTDINLLKDLLDYILPAGMSCNITKEFQITKQSTTELTSTDELKIYKNIGANRVVVPVNTDETSIVTKVEESGITDALAKDTPGLIANSDIRKIQ